MLPELSTLVLERMSRGEPVSAVHLSLGAGASFAYRVADAAPGPVRTVVLA